MLCKQEVVGSIPITSTICRGGVESNRKRLMRQEVIGSIPFASTIW